MSKGKKKPSKAVQLSPISPSRYIQQFGRKLELDSCLVTSGWEENGLAGIFVLRRKQSGKIVFGSFVVDMFCLGLKDTFFKLDYTDADFELMLDSIYQTPLEPIDPNLAFNIIYGGIEYAEDLGFAPHKDFKITEYLLPPVEEVPYMEVEFGKDGQPYYFEGPNDNAAKVIAILNKSVGSDGYIFVPIDEDDDDDDYDDEEEE
jgi:hypothetical protein